MRLLFAFLTVGLFATTSHADYSRQSDITQMAKIPEKYSRGNIITMTAVPTRPGIRLPIRVKLPLFTPYLQGSVQEKDYLKGYAEGYVQLARLVAR